MNEFEIDKRAMRRAFNRAAASYDAAAVLQREICARMLERLDYIKLQPAHILDVGSGTGWGTRRLGERYPQAGIVALDIALGCWRPQEELRVGGRSCFPAAGSALSAPTPKLCRSPRKAWKWYGQTSPCSGA